MMATGWPNPSSGETTAWGLLRPGRTRTGDEHCQSHAGHRWDTPAELSGAAARERLWRSQQGKGSLIGLRPICTHQREHRRRSPPPALCADRRPVEPAGTADGRRGRVASPCTANRWHETCSGSPASSPLTIRTQRSRSGCEELRLGARHSSLCVYSRALWM